jgi:flagellar assembly factor FliW
MAEGAIALNTTRFGDLEVRQDQILEFPKGILGFEAHRHYALIEDVEFAPFVHLQSLEDPALAFTIVNPKIFFPHYKVQVDRQEIMDMAVRNLDSVQTWVIVTVPEDAKSMSANLQGPILINLENNCGKQVVLVRSPYTTRHYLMDELRKQEDVRPSGVHPSGARQHAGV